VAAFLTDRDKATVFKSPGYCVYLSTPEEKCIGFPEQKYISEAGKKGR
jgi:hypothetical protein